MSGRVHVDDDEGADVIRDVELATLAFTLNESILRPAGLALRRKTTQRTTSSAAMAGLR